MNALAAHACEKEAELATLCSTAQHHEKSLDEHHHSLYGGGSGDPGVVRTVDSLSTWRTDMERSKDAQRAFQNQVRISLLVIFATAIINIFLKR